MSDEMIVKRPVPRTDDAAPTERASETQRLELDIHIDKVRIGDIRAIDALGSGKSGAFDAGVDVLARFIRNEDFDINDLDIDQFQQVAKLVSEEIGRVINAKNSRGASPRH